MIKRLLISSAATFLMLLLGSPFSQAQTALTFTNAGATGRIGPTQSQVNAAYASTNLAGKVTVTNGIQYWTVPSTGTYTIEASGAQGAGTNGGKGAKMSGEFFLSSGTILKIIVGQKGTELLTSRFDYSGGGGSFVANSLNNSAIIVAGGGGGAEGSGATSNGVTSTAGANGGGGHSNGIGGINGLGGTYSNQTSDGGAGFTGNGGSGNPTPAPQAFTNGGGGGCNSWSTGVCAPGGFGGGGSTNRLSTTYHAAGGGGGYSGGGAAYGTSTGQPFAGGGGSFNSGTNQTNIAGFQVGHGEVVIIQPPTAPNDAGITNILSPNSDCGGSVQDVEVEVANLGTNQVFSVEIHWTVNSVTQPVFTYSSLLDTANGTGPSTADVVIGSMTLLANTTYDIIAWTELPNNAVDPVNSNDTSDVTIQGYGYPTVDLGVDTTICPYDVLILDAGSGRDSILWNTSATTRTITADSARTYMVSVWENGCPGGDTFNLSFFPQPPPVNLGLDTMICYGDSILLDATAPGVTYLWQDNSTGPTLYADTARNYSVTIEDNNTCKSTDDINVSLFTEPVVSLSVVPRNTICYGSPFEFRAASFTQGSTMYQWKINGVNSGGPTTNNKFSPTTMLYGDSAAVDLLTNVCNTTTVESDYITMFINPQPRTIGGSSEDTVLENSSKNYLVPLTPGSTFTWFVVGGKITTPAIGNAVSVDWEGPMDTAKIMVGEKDNGNCSYTNVRNIVIISIIGINDKDQHIGLGRAYPNPANTTVTIPVVSKGNWNVDLSLYDMTGKKVKSIYNGVISGNRDFTFAVDDLENGMYFYKVTTSDGYESVNKINIQH